MERFEDFAKRNRTFGDSTFHYNGELEKCYAIAQEVEKTYNELYGNSTEPQYLDIVEFADDYNVYKHAMICEDHYGKNKYGMLCVCERGSTHTNGKDFSTSGGAFLSIHKSKLQFAGYDENVVWTWGCHGSGAHQGIYFPLKVRKWIIPYETPKFGSKVFIRGKDTKDKFGNPLYAVWIENYGGLLGCAKHFNSIKAFKAWAEYVGYNSCAFEGTFNRVSAQKVEHRCITKMEALPENAKPMKVISNGEVHDGWVVNDGNTITELYLNASNPDKKRYEYGTKEWKEQSDRDHELFCKYCGNPMGV